MWCLRLFKGEGGRLKIGLRRRESRDKKKETKNTGSLDGPEKWATDRDGFVPRSRRQSGGLDSASFTSRGWMGRTHVGFLVLTPKWYRGPRTAILVLEALREGASKGKIAAIFH